MIDLLIDQIRSLTQQSVAAKEAGVVVETRRAVIMIRNIVENWMDNANEGEQYSNANRNDHDQRWNQGRTDRTTGQNDQGGRF